MKDFNSTTNDKYVDIGSNIFVKAPEWVTGDGNSTYMCSESEDK